MKIHPRRSRGNCTRMDSEINYIGTKSIWGGTQAFGIAAQDRRSHMHVIGQTGVGKSMLFLNMILQDIEAGRGVGVIDPHGALITSLLPYIPSRRTDDVLCLFPEDVEHPIGFNFLKTGSLGSPSVVASGIVGMFRNLWEDSWGPRLEYILYNCIASLLECQNVSLLSLHRMLSDFRYREWVIRQVKDSTLKFFWVYEFNRYDERYRREAIAPIQNKVGQLLNTPVLKHMLGNVQRAFDPLFMMDDSRIMLANLSIGQIGEGASHLLGSLLVNQFELAARRREVTSDTCRDFHLYVDEFQNFATDAFASTLSECRKYGLCLTLAHQYFDQLKPSVAKAVLGNVGTTVAFRVGDEDSLLLERKFGMVYPARQLVELDNQQIAVKLLNDGGYGDAFLGRTLTLHPKVQGHAENIIRRSREKFGTSRAVIEDKLRRWNLPMNY